MAQTITVSDAAIARGKLLSWSDPVLVLGLAESDYQIHLAVAGKVEFQVGKPIAGRISAKAKRVDVVTTGGRFIEPVMGRPRRLQGTIIATDPVGNSITVKCHTGGVFTCDLMVPQRAEKFANGMLVACDIERGACFEPM